MIETPLGAHTRVAIAGRQSYLDRDLKLFTSRDVGDFIAIPSLLRRSAQARARPRHQRVGSAVRPALERHAGAHGHQPRSRTDQDRRDPRRVRAGDGALPSPIRGWFVGRRHPLDRPRSSAEHLELRRHADRARHRAPLPMRCARTGEGRSRRTFRCWRGSTSKRSRRRSRARALSRSRRARATCTCSANSRAFRSNVDNWNTTIASLAPYGQLDVSLFGDSLHILPGIRLEPYITSGNRVIPVDRDTAIYRLQQRRYRGRPAYRGSLPTEPPRFDQSRFRHLSSSAASRGSLFGRRQSRAGALVGHAPLGRRFLQVDRSALDRGGGLLFALERPRFAQRARAPPTSPKRWSKKGRGAPTVVRYCCATSSRRGSSVGRATA